SAQGKPLWTARYGAKNGADDEAFAIGVDGGGNVAVIGEGRGSPETPDAVRAGCLTIQYDSRGKLLWVRGTVVESDRIERIRSALAGGESQICGEAFNKSGERITRTIVRDEHGLLKWCRDAPYEIGDDLGPVVLRSYHYAIFISGTAAAATTARDYFIQAYNRNGTLLWNHTFDSQRGQDVVRAMSLDRFGRPIVSGQCGFG